MEELATVKTAINQDLGYKKSESSSSPLLEHSQPGYKVPAQKSLWQKKLLTQHLFLWAKIPTASPAQESTVPRASAPNFCLHRIPSQKHQTSPEQPLSVHGSASNASPHPFHFCGIMNLQKMPSPPFGLTTPPPLPVADVQRNNDNFHPAQTFFFWRFCERSRGDRSKLMETGVGESHPVRR